MDDLTGQTLRGYELRERIGAGGFGAVYKAFQPLVGREVAIKVILPVYANQPEFIRRFEAEAQLVARLEHPFIVPLFDYWRDPDGAYLVMRFFKGGSLRERLAQGILDRDAVIRVVDQISSALAVAHRNHVVHRDLKPDNILLDQDGNAYLTDFGIAKDVGTQKEKEEEGVSGSPAYLSPEQITSERTTERTDIYALGVMLYELVVGSHPFHESTLTQLIFNHLHDPLPLVPTLSDEINGIIQKATAKNPLERYADVLALAADFRRALNGGMTAVESYELDLSTLTNPYKGLRAFEEADAMDFFGREALTDQLVARLSETGVMAHFLAVVGPSGSGKSSVVKAGLIPALRQGFLPGAERWFVAEMTPGAQPLKALAQALLSVAVQPRANLLERLTEDAHGLVRAAEEVLAGTGSELLLVIDQFEEVFTLVEDERERALFLDLLRVAVSEANSRLRVIVTLRADFYDKPLLYEGFGALIQARTQVVLPLTADEIQRAVIGPAERVGLLVDSNLLAAIVADVREEPGALPLLQYALTEVFERREGRNLTLDAYSASGGALGALARRAEELYSTMDSARQAATRQLFLRLVTLGEGAEDTRRRVSWNELLALSSDGHIPDAMQDVLDSFGKYRLLSFDRDPQTRAPTVEVGHEALIREWTRLREWLDESRESVRLERQLASAAAEWENAKRDPSFLLHGTRLAQFEEWAGETDLALTRAERDYLQASVAERKRQEAAEAERRTHEAALEQQSRNRLRTLVGVMTVAAVIGLALAGLAFNQSVVAQNNAATATIAQGLAVIEAGNAQTQAAIVQVERDKADAARSTSDANAALAATNAAAAQTQAAIAERNANEAQGLALAAGSQQALSAGNTDLALALAVEATKLDQPPPQAQHALIAAAYAPGTERLLRGHTGRVFDAVFSADQQWVLSIGGDGNLLLWNITSGKEAYRATLGDDQLDQLHGSISLNADGSEALITLSSGKLILWDVPSWKEIRRFNTDIGIWKAVFLPGSHTALVSYNLNSSNLRLIDLDSGQVVRNFGASGDGHKSGVPAIAISPDGRYALSGSGDDTLILWDIASGTAVRTYAGHTGTVSAVAFSPDGNTFASAAADGGGIVWNTQTGEQLHTFIYKGGGFESAAFSPDGRTILTGATGGMLLLWDAQTANLLRHYVGHDSDVNSAVFSADGRTILSASSDTTLRLWSVNSGAELRQIEINNKVRSLAVSPDQKTMLVGASDGNLGLWNFVDEKKVRDFPKQGDSILAIQYAPDGRTAISTSYDGNVAFWDVASGVELHRYHQDNATASDVVLTPDKQSAVASVFSFSGYLSGTDFVVLDIASGQEIRKFRIDGTVSSFAFSPDGQTILVGLLTGSVEPTGGLLSLDFSSGKTLHQFEYPSTSPVYSVAISPDGKWGLAGSGDANVTLWDMATGKEIRRFVGHSDEVHSVAFSMDGNLALSTSQDASVILWDVSTGQEIVRFTGHTDRVHAVFSPDGKTIFSGSSDGSLRQWRVPPSLDQLLDWTRRTRYIADLTCDQRAFYRVQPLCAASGALPTATP